MPRAALTAVLGPTNTGKTHLAIERMCAHSSGMMGFPLRLLAREVFDRVRAIKGNKAVALVTGEEKIVPPDARWLICTVESMPTDRDVAFVAIDEAQLGADPERGHVFTERLLRARGREETMILGSATAAPLVRALLPDAEIIKRPRFSDLSYLGPKKLSRLPKRSAIVAFSAEEVYGIAETIRRSRGGSAVVMGALSPRTRNAQVAMFEAGEVDYLVATDAIGMGLNLDLGHVAFANLSKFDGKRQRRLNVPEMAQIAGRAGRHQRNGTFGILAGGARNAEFTDEEIDRIENHRFAPLDHLFWRNSDLDYTCLDDLIASLEMMPPRIELRAAPEGVDLAVLKILASDETIRSTARSTEAVRRLWEVCGLPDFRQIGPEPHARLVARLFGHLSTPARVIPDDMIASELNRLDSVQGDIGTLTGRIAAVRTWSYVSQRADWLTDHLYWADCARALEERLSDALHAKLIQRFVDRRTTVLMQGTEDLTATRIAFSEDGRVVLEEETIGWLRGFDLKIDPSAPLGERKMIAAAIERQLPREFAVRFKRLCDAPNSEFSFVADMGKEVEIAWRGWPVARLQKGRSLLAPAIKPIAGVSGLAAEMRQGIVSRLRSWLENNTSARLTSLVKLEAMASDPDTPAELRAIVAALSSAAGLAPRQSLEHALSALAPEQRRALKRAGITIGSLDVFHPALLKPEAVRLRLALLAVRDGKPMPPVPMPGLTLLDRPAPALAEASVNAGYRRFGEQFVRIDLVERMARVLHEQRQGKPQFVPDTHIAARIGVGDATMQKIMHALGFRPAPTLTPGAWRWRGRERARPANEASNPSFEALKAWNPRGRP